MSMGIRITGKAVRTHISSEMARELIAIYQTMYHLWFLESQRVLPQLGLHLPRHHLHHRSQHRLTVIQFRKTEMLKLQCQKGIEVWMESFGETSCMIPQKPKTEKKRESKEVQRDISHELPDWLQEFRKIWLMKVLQHSLGETQSKEVKTLPSHMESSAKVEPGSGKHSVFRHFPKDPNCEICLMTKITRGSCRRRADAVVPRAEIFGDLITADHKVLSEESESRNNHRYAVVVQDSANQWLQSYPCKTKSSKETQKNLMKFLEPTRKPKVIYTDNSLEFGKSCEELSWNHCTSTPHRSETNGIAERAVRREKRGDICGASAVRSGNEWWADSLECYCYLRNIG